MPSHSPTPPSAALDKHHRDNNRVTAGSWAPFSDHRDRQTALVLGAGGQTLAVLGAGNCNDLDLDRLAPAFSNIDLVDLDEEAVRRARDRQPTAVAAKLALRAPIDLSGAFDALPRLRGKTLSAEQLAALSRAATDKVVAALPERFDTVLSACLLSQLMHSCYVALGPNHPQLADIANAIAVAHLHALLALVRPGGSVILATDTVSSETYPLRELWGERAPADLLAHLEETNNVLSGTAVSFVRRSLATSASALVGPPRLVEPWLWQMHEEVTMLVYALVMQRRHD